MSEDNPYVAPAGTVGRTGPDRTGSGSAVEQPGGNGGLAGTVITTQPGGKVIESDKRSARMFEKLSYRWAKFWATTPETETEPKKATPEKEHGDPKPIEVDKSEG